MQRNPEDTSNTTRKNKFFSGDLGVEKFLRGRISLEEWVQGESVRGTGKLKKRTLSLSSSVMALTRKMSGVNQLQSDHKGEGEKHLYVVKNIQKLARGKDFATEGKVTDFLLLPRPAKVFAEWCGFWQKNFRNQVCNKKVASAVSAIK